MDTYPRTFFGLDRYEVLPIDLGPVPHFEETTIEENERYRVYINNDGTKLKEFKDRVEGINVSYQFLEFPVKTREDFLRMKERFNPHSPRRYPEFFEDYKRHLKERDYPIRLNLEGLFWWVRKMMGLEATCTAIYRNPELVQEMVDFIVDFQIKVLDKILSKEEIIDYVIFFEDVAYKKGPMISAKTVREFMLHGYRQITSFLRDHGVDIIIVDSDGYTEPLIPVWLEAGINGNLPCEAAANMNPVALRKKYGKELIIVGGIDKRAISMDKETIRKEVLSKVPDLVKIGGYIPSIDHQVPYEVSFENYLYYLKIMRKVTQKPR
jgi:uroporphyrinogen decarboxylase